ncbi:MAG: hypothetical protein AAF371_06680 [Pseudomonadota bacterium]
MSDVAASTAPKKPSAALGAVTILFAPILVIGAPNYALPDGRHQRAQNRAPGTAEGRSAFHARGRMPV